MKKFISMMVLMTAFSATAMADEPKPCAFQCVVTTGTGEFALNPQDFRAVGGFTADQNTNCVATLRAGQKDIRFVVNDLFGLYTIQTITDGVDTISSQSPSGKGQYKLADQRSKLEFACYRR
jgi:hypothetical protein